MDFRSFCHSLYPRIVGSLHKKKRHCCFDVLELILNAVNLQFVAAAVHHGDASGWVYAVFAIAIAAAEVAIGLAIFLSMYGKHETISLDEVNLLKQRCE